MINSVDDVKPEPIFSETDCWEPVLCELLSFSPVETELFFPLLELVVTLSLVPELSLVPADSEDPLLSFVPVDSDDPLLLLDPLLREELVPLVSLVPLDPPFELLDPPDSDVEL